MEQNQANAFPTNWKCQCGFDNRPINLICGGANRNLGCSNPKPGVVIPPALLEAQAIVKQLDDYLQKELATNPDALSAENLNSIIIGIQAILTKIIESRNGNVEGRDLSEIFKVMLEAKLFSKSQAGYIDNHIIAAQKALKENNNLTLSTEQKGLILKTVFSIVRNINMGIIPWVANGCNGRAPGEGGAGGRGGRRRRGRGRGRGRRRPLKPPPGATLDKNDPKYDLCWAFYTKGACKRGDKCKWRHGEVDPNAQVQNMTMGGDNNNNNNNAGGGQTLNLGGGQPASNNGGFSFGAGNNQNQGLNLGGGATQPKLNINFGNAI